MIYPKARYIRFKSKDRIDPVDGFFFTDELDREIGDFIPGNVEDYDIEDTIIENLDLPDSFPFEIEMRDM